MPKGIGKAFKTALDREEELSKKGRKKGKANVIFMSDTRIKIFQYLCERPCSHASRITEELDIAPQTLRWHLRKMIEEGYVLRKTVGKKHVFYPAGMIKGGDVPLLSFLVGENPRRIFTFVLENPGTSQKALGKDLGLSHQTVIWFTSRMVHLGLITAVADGKYKRYYPTELIKDKRADNRKRLRNFRGNLIKRLGEDGFRPTIIRGTDVELIVQIRVSSEKKVLNLHIDPYFTILQWESSPGN